MEASTDMDTSDVASFAKSARLLSLLKENRIEMMVITILLYSTGLFDRAVNYGVGVCA